MNSRIVFIVLFCLLKILPRTANAQIENLSFEALNQNYVEVLGGTLLASGDTVFNKRISYTSPFSLTVYNESTLNPYLRIYSNGFINNSDFIGVTQTNPFTGFFSNTQVALSPFATQLKGKSTSSIRCLISGIAPYRVLTIQWKDFGVGNNAQGTINFQCKIFETINQVQYCYGACTVPTNTNVFIGIKTSNSGLHQRTQSTGIWSETQLASSTSASCLLTPNQPLLGNSAFLLKNPAPAVCPPPSQISSLSVTQPVSSSTSFNISIGTINASGAEGYLALATKNSLPILWPVQGQEYVSGDSIGNSRVTILQSTQGYINASVIPGDSIFVTVFPYRNSFCSNGVVYQVANPLSDTIVVAAPLRNYYFVPTSGTQDLLTSSNWSPNRSAPSNSDTLHFTNGGDVTLTFNSGGYFSNFSVLHVGAGTTVKFEEVDKAFNGIIVVDSGATMRLSMLSSGNYYYIDPNSRIDGLLVLENSAVAEPVAAPIEVNGTLMQLGPYTSINIQNYFQTSPLTFNPGSTYLHNRNGGNIPFANFHPSSTIQINNITTTVPSFPTNTSVGDLIVNCPDFELSNFNLNNNLNRVQGDLQVLSLGGPNKSFTIPTVVGNAFIVNGNIQVNEVDLKFTGNILLRVDGNIQLTNCNYDASSAYNHNLTLGGNLIQTPDNSFKLSNTFSNTNTYQNNYLNFVGAAPQTIQLGNSQFGACEVMLNNPTGIILNSDLNINDNSRFRIKSGVISGIGNLSYSGINNQLIYDSIPEFITNREWPNDANIGEVFINLSPGRQIQLTEDKSIDTLHLNTGNLLLGNFNLSVEKKLNYTQTTPTTTGNLIIQNGTGRFTQSIKPTVIPVNYSFPIGHLNNENSPVSNSLWFRVFNNSIERYIGADFFNFQYPQAGDSSLLAHWKLHDSENLIPFDFSLSADYLPSQLALPNLTYYPEIFSQNSEFDLNGIANSKLILDRQLPQWPLLDQSIITAKPRESITYVWTGAIDSLFETPQNWLPVRLLSNATDILIFNNGLQDTIYNIPEQHISQLQIVNNTGITVYPKITNNGLGTILNINANIASDSMQLYIAPNCALSIFSSQGEKWNWFTGLGKNQIAGTLNVHSAIDSVTVDTRISKTEFTNESWLKLTGTLYKGFVSSLSNCTFSGRYELAYSQGGGQIYIPQMVKRPGSKIFIRNDGISNTYSYNVFGWSALDTTQFSVVEFDCPTLDGYVSINNQLLGDGIDSLIVRSTGNGSLLLPMNNSYTFKSIVQYSGKIRFFVTSYSANSGVVSLTGDFIQHAGRIEGSSSVHQLKFIGSGQLIQRLKLQDGGSYRLRFVMDNPEGIEAIPASATQPYLYFGESVSLEVNQPVLHPIRNIQEVPIQCYPLGTTIIYAADTRIDSLLFASPNPPFRLNLLGIDTLISNLEVRELYVGDKFYIDNHSLTIDPLNFYSLGFSYQGGLIFGSQGSFAIKIKSSTVPIGSFIQFPNSYGYEIPTLFGDSLSRLRFAVYPDSILSDGTIRIRPVLVDSTSIQIIALSDTLGIRSNFGWNFQVEDGLTIADSSIWMQASYPFPYIPNEGEIGIIKLINTNQLLGVDTVTIPLYSWEQNYNQQCASIKINLSEINQDTIFFGFTLPVPKPYISVQTGDWNNPNTWNLNSVPTNQSNVIIQAEHVVSIADNSHCKYLRLEGTLAIDTDSLFLDSIYISQTGLLHQQGGFTRLGNEGGSNCRWLINGAIEVTDGFMEVNGGLSFNGQNSELIQDGGTILFDPYASVNPSPIAPLIFTTGAVGLIEISTSTNCMFSGGVLQFLDPMPDSTHQFIRVGYIIPPIFSGSHTTIFGSPQGLDGLDIKMNLESSQAGYNIVLFNHITLYSTLQNSSSKRNIFKVNNLNVNGQLSIFNQGAILDCNYLRLAGDLYSDSLTLCDINSLYFENLNGTPILTPQRVYGAGKLKKQEMINSDTSFVASLIINNQSIQGVSYEKGNLGVTSLYLRKGVLNMNNKMISVVNISTSNPNSWVRGVFQNRDDYFNISNNPLHFPLGDSLRKINIEIGKQYVLNQFNFIGKLELNELPISAQNFLNNQQRVQYGFTLSSSNSNLTNCDWRIKFPIQPSICDVGVTQESLYCLFSPSNTTNWEVQDSAEVLNDTLSLSFENGSAIGTYYIGELSPGIYINKQPKSATHCFNLPSQLFVEANTSANSTAQWEILQNGIWSSFSSPISFSGVDTITLELTNQDYSINNTWIRLKMWNNTGTVYSDSAFYNLVDQLSIPLSLSFVDSAICENSIAEINVQGFENVIGAELLWYENGLLDPEFTNQLTFTKDQVLQGDYVSVRLLRPNTCQADSFLYYPPLVLSITPGVQPEISITTNNAEFFCQDQTIQVNALSENGGASPVFQWYVNDQLVENTLSSIQISPDSNQIEVQCFMQSSTNCPLDSIVMSNSLNFRRGTTPSNPSVSLFNDGPSLICAPGTFNLEAVAYNLSQSPIIQWNFSPNITNIDYSDDLLGFQGNIVSGGDTIWTTVSVQNAAECGVSAIAQSDTVFFYGRGYTVPTVSIQVSPTDTIIDGQLLTFTANLSGTEGYQIEYEWTVNGSPVSDLSFFTSYDLVPGQNVRLNIVAIGPCSNELPIWSNFITMKALPSTIGFDDMDPASKIYPNPMVEGFFIPKNTGQSITGIQLLDLTGKLVFSQAIQQDLSSESNWISLPSNLADGIYFIEFLGSDLPRQRIVKISDN